MLQAIGLTSTPRRNRPPAVHDLTFEARPGRVTALFGAPGSGKTTALRLMLGLERGRGVTYFRGRPLHRAAHPLREVGAFLGGVPGHPARSVRGQLRMVCAAAGVPAARADELLDAVGLAELRDQRLGTLSLGMERRLGIAAALLAGPHALVLDDPAAGLPPRHSGWLPGLLRAHADGGGTVLFTTDDPKQAARTADHVVAVVAGRLVADQDAAVFARARLRPCVTVHTPHAARLAAHLAREARAARRPLEAVTDTGNRLYVYGGTCAEVGETAFRHGILLHRLTPDTTPAPPQPDAPAADRPRRHTPSTAPPAPSPSDPGPARTAPGALAAGGPRGDAPFPARTDDFAPPPDGPSPSSPVPRDPDPPGTMPGAFGRGGPRRDTPPTPPTAPADAPAPPTDCPSSPKREPRDPDPTRPAPGTLAVGGPRHDAPSIVPADGSTSSSAPSAPSRTVPPRSAAPLPLLDDSVVRGSACGAAPAPRGGDPASRSPLPVGPGPGPGRSRPGVAAVAPGATCYGEVAFGHAVPGAAGEGGPAGGGTAPGPASGRAGGRPRAGSRPGAAAPGALPGVAGDGARAGGAGPVRRPAEGSRHAAPRRAGRARPLRYELRRVGGVPGVPVTIGVTLLVSAVLAVLLARAGRAPLPEVLAGWPAWLPLPPAALGAGLIGAFSYGHEFRYPVLQHALGAAPRRLGLLLAKLAVTAAAALLLAVAVGVVNLEALRLFYGGALIPVPENWPGLCAAWAGLLVGSGWAGLLAAGLFRATAAGPAAVLAVPVAIAPLVERALAGPSTRSIEGFPARLRELAWGNWPREAGHWLDGALRALAQPVGLALTLSLSALFCAFLFDGLRRDVRR